MRFGIYDLLFGAVYPIKLNYLQIVILGKTLFSRLLSYSFVFCTERIKSRAKGTDRKRETVNYLGINQLDLVRRCRRQSTWKSFLKYGINLGFIVPRDSNAEVESRPPIIESDSRE